MPTAVYPANYNKNRGLRTSKLFNYRGYEMEKYVNYAPIGLLFAYVTKVLVTGIKVPEAIGIVALSGLAFAWEHARDRKSVETIQNQMNIKQDEVLKELARMQDEVKQFKTEMESTKSYVSASKIASSLRVGR